MTFPVAKQARRKAHWAVRVEGKNTGFGTKPRSLLLEDYHPRMTVNEAMRWWKHDVNLWVRKLNKGRKHVAEQKEQEVRSEVPAFGT